MPTPHDHTHQFPVKTQALGYASRPSSAQSGNGAGQGKNSGSGESLVDQKTLKVVSWLVAGAFFMQMLDGTILNTALPSIAKSIGVSPLQMQSVVIAYLVTVALLIPTSGWISDRFGAKRTFFCATMLFCLGSLCCALSESLTTLIAARVLQGVGGALMAPVGRLVIVKIVPRSALVQVMSFVMLPGLIGPLLGPTVGGLLSEYISWHWIFLINIPVGIVGALFTLWYMPMLTVKKTAHFDCAGFLMFGFAMVALALAVEGLGEMRLPGYGLYIAWGVGIACLVGYCLYARRARNPLFRLGIFCNRAFSLGIAGNLFSRLGSGATPFLVPLLLQVALGYSPATAGLTMIPLAAGSMLAKTFASPLVGRFGFRRVLMYNTVLQGLAIISFSLLSGQTSYVLILAHLFLFGMINSTQFTAMNTATIFDVQPDDVSSCNAVFSVVQQLAVSFGVSLGALFLGMYTAGISPAAASPALLSGFHKAFLSVGMFTLASAVIFVAFPGELGKKEAGQERGT